MKKSVFLTLLMFSVSVASFAATLPAEFRKDLEAQDSRIFNRNAGLSFVYNTYFMFDKHVPVDGFLKNLATTGLNMQFPDAALKSPDDFQKWYKGIGDSIKAQTHTVESLDVTYGPGKTMLVHVIVHWQAETKKGEYLSFLAEQNWTLVEEAGSLKIKDYLVKEAQGR